MFKNLNDFDKAKKLKDKILMEKESDDFISLMQMLLNAINEIYDEVEEYNDKEILNKAIKTKDKNKIKEVLIETIFSDYYGKCYECKKTYSNGLLNYDDRLKENFCDKCYKNIKEERNKKYEQNQKIASKHDLIIILNKAMIYNKKEEIQQIIDTCFKCQF